MLVSEGCQVKTVRRACHGLCEAPSRWPNSPSCSWAACILYKIAIQENVSPESWVGRSATFFEGKPINVKYLLALYFSVNTFSGAALWHSAPAHSRTRRRCC